MNADRCCANCRHAEDAKLQYPPSEYIRSFELMCTYPIIAPSWLSFLRINAAVHPDDGKGCPVFQSIAIKPKSTP